MLLPFFSSASQVQLKFTSYATALSYGRSSLALELPNPFNGLFSVTIWVSCDTNYHISRSSRYQKGKTSLGLIKAKDGWIFGCSDISWTICKPSAHRFGWSSWRPTNSDKAGGLKTRDWKTQQQTAGLVNAGKGMYGKPNSVLPM